MFTVNDVLQKKYPQLVGDRWHHKPTSFFLRFLLKEKEINSFIEAYPHLNGIDFVEEILEYFHFSYTTRDREKENIPVQGRLVIIANQPIGSLDGLALIKLISEIRRDIKVVTSEAFLCIKPLAQLLLPTASKKQALETDQRLAIQQHLEREGVVIMFPANEVSRLKPNGIRDTRWQADFLNLASDTKALILPVFLDGKNSPLFYTLSMIYKPLATLMLVREMFKKRTKHLPIRVGETIAYESYNNPAINSHQKVKLLKKHLYRIGLNKRPIFKTQRAVALPEDRKALSKAIKQCEPLGETGDGKKIVLYQHSESSPILREIGRLREIAFRAVGEGSHQRRDIDPFDSHYYHLILWDSDELEIVGAYRLGDAKRLTKARDNKLYSAALFKYNDEKMAPYFAEGLELGRSFIQPKYWGKRSLDYLWYGLGAFLKSRPQYRYLFGPVSISAALPDMAKDLLVYFYRLYFSTDQALAKAPIPYRVTADIESLFSGDDYKKDFTTLKNLLTNMGAAIPTLYKQYTEIYEDGGVHFLDFGIDPAFNHCIDGLVLADTHKLKEKRRKRYMGE